MDLQEIKSFLDLKVEQYNQPSFLDDDPVSLPHLFEKKEDIEIVGFLLSIIAWGNRKSIIKSGNRLIEIMQNDPHEFVLNYDSEKHFPQFVHRTFNSEDLDFFFRSLQSIYQDKGGLEKVFPQKSNQKGRIESFRKTFLEVPHFKRSEKHIANPSTGSSAKRINMFLRWMIRGDEKGVDFGIWKNHDMATLYVPLDVHTANSARKLGLIKRTSNDWKALDELMQHLQSFCPNDPCKYDFALFGLSVNNEI